MHPYHLSSPLHQLCVASLKANNKQEKGDVYGSLNYSWQLQDQSVGKKRERERDEEGGDAKVSGVRENEKGTNHSNKMKSIGWSQPI